MAQEEFIVTPQDNIDTFDKEKYQDRLNHLTNLIMEKLVEQDVKRHAKECREKFEPVSPYPYNEIQIREMFYEKAKAEAERIIEQERKNFVKRLEPHIRRHLNLIISQAKMLVFTEHGKGKLIRIKKPIVGSFPKESHIFEVTEFSFEEDNPTGREIYFLICRLKDALGSYSKFVPYMDKDLKDLWSQASQLLDLEIVDAHAETQKATE